MTAAVVATYIATVAWALFWIHGLVLAPPRRKAEANQIIARASSDALLGMLEAKQGLRSGYGYPRHHADGRTDDQVAHEEWVAAWLRPNDEFILETDRVLNDIEWAKLNSEAVQAGGADDRWEQVSS